MRSAGNSLPNMPTWGAKDARLGNDPLTLGFLRRDGDILVDMAMSQFSYGARITYPVERRVKVAEDNPTQGIPVDDVVWQNILGQ